MADADVGPDGTMCVLARTDQGASVRGVDGAPTSVSIPFGGVTRYSEDGTLLAAARAEEVRGAEHPRGPRARADHAQEAGHTSSQACGGAHDAGAARLCSSGGHAPSGSARGLVVSRSSIGVPPPHLSYAR